MNEICKRYHIAEEDYKKMLRDGILSTTIEGYATVYECFKRHRNSTGSDTEAVYRVCDELKTGRTRVYDIVAKFR